MKIKRSKVLQYYYTSVLLVLVMSLGYGIYLYWSKGSLNIENISSIVEASVEVDKLTRRDDLQEIDYLVENDRLREAFSILENLETTAHELNYIENVKSYGNLKNYFKEAKESINGLLSSSKLSDIIQVLGNKILEFENLAISNNWRTLTRMSRRMKFKLYPGNRKKGGFYNYQKIRGLIRGIEKDIKIMINVTESSILSRDKKVLILAKVNTLKTEVVMLNQYVSKLKMFRDVYQRLDSSYKRWFKDIKPEISYRKLQFENHSQVLLFSLLGVIGFIFLSVAVGYMLFKYEQKKSEREIEDFAIKIIEDGIVPVENRLRDQYSNFFQKKIEKIRGYVHKRMSFGTIFQEGVPFASLLLDSNLNLIWANKFFYQQWGLPSTDNQNVICWDYLQRFTNLGENDPVLSAVREKVAGIYQIQVKINQSEGSLPYEMYVTPVEYAEQLRIMIFLYPLRSLEETIYHQTKSIVGPVSRTLDALTQNKLDSKFMEEISKDFEIAGISSILDKFELHHDYISQQRMGLLGEIDRLEDELFDQYKLMNDFEEILSDVLVFQKSVVSQFDDIKNAIVSTIESRYRVEKLYENTIGTTKKLFKNDQNLLHQSESCRDMLQENISGVRNIIDIKKSLKSCRKEIEDSKIRLSQALDQVMIFQKREDVSINIEHGLNKIKIEGRAFEKVMANFSKMMIGIDVATSKMEMIIDQKTDYDFSSFRNEFDNAKSVLESDMFLASKMERSAQEGDDLIIKSLKQMYTTVIDSRQKLQELCDIAEAARPQLDHHNESKIRGVTA